jgi:ketosteroid isomerase-like protein
MSRANVEHVQRSLEAWNHHDVDAVLAIVPEDAQWVIAEENPNARTLRGPDEIGAYLRDWLDTMPNLRIDATDYIDTGDAVVTLGTVSGQAGADGPDVTVEIAIVTRFVGGRAMRTEEYLNSRQALAAVGLPE